MLTNDEITNRIEHDEIINGLYVIEEHGLNGEVQFRVAYEDTGEPTNGNQYAVFETMAEAVDYMNRF